MSEIELKRCLWAGSDPLYLSYHDNEWGVPLHDDRALFELLILEGAQAGLSWLTILKKRAAYRQAFDHFDVALVAAYDEAKILTLLSNSGIVRNQLKVRSAVTNAKAFLRVADEFGSFHKYLWRIVNNRPIQNHWHTSAEVPARTEQSDKLSIDLKQREFKFIGSTICYALLQAAGLVNDHLVGCFRWDQVTQLAGHAFN